VRLPVYPDLYHHEDDYLRRFVDPVMEEAGRQGAYVLLTWHGQGNPLTGQHEQVAWRHTPPWRGNPTNPDERAAQSALSTMARRYRGAPHVLYGIFSEPAYITWEAWRPVAERLIDAVRAEHPDAVVFVPGVDWGYDLSGALADPVRRPNIVYETHPYPKKGEAWKTWTPELASRAPVFIGEWGFEPYPGTPSLETYGRDLLAFSGRYGLGWIAWVWSETWQPALLDRWEGFRPTAYGRFVRDALRAR